MPTARPSSFLDTFLSLLTPRHPTGSAMGRQRSLLTLNRPEQAFIAGRRLLSARTDAVLCISLAPSVLAERKQHPQLHVVLMADLVWEVPGDLCLFRVTQRPVSFLKDTLSIGQGAGKGLCTVFLWLSWHPHWLQICKLLPLWAEKGDFGLGLLPCILSLSTTGPLLHKI